MNKKLFVLVLVFTVNYSFSQVTSDAKLWTGISVIKKINNFELSFNEELRLHENFSTINKVFSEFGIAYKINNFLAISGNYRFNRKNNYELGGFYTNQRFNVDVSYKHKFNKFKFSYRTRLQHKIDYNKKTPYNLTKTYSRNKFSIKYKLSNVVVPFLSYEFFYQFNNQNIINRNRIALGSSLKINDTNSLKLFYMFEDKFNVKKLRYNHIWGINYVINI